MSHIAAEVTPSTMDATAKCTSSGEHTTPKNSASLVDQVLALAGPLNVNPLVEAIQFATKFGPYFKEKKEEADGEPVFRIHAGVPAVVATDTVSAAFALSADISVLDREPIGAIKKFGPLGVTPGLIGNALPALLANQKCNHKGIRDFTVAMFRARMGNFQASFDKAMANALDDILKPSSKWNTEEVSQRVGGELMYQWLLGTEAPSPEASLWFGKASASFLQTDSWASNAVFSTLTKLKNAVESGKNKRYLAEVLATVPKSPYFRAYKDMALQYGVPLEDLDRLVLYVIQVNAAFPLMFMLRASIATLANQYSTLALLREEIGDAKITPEHVKDLEVLDSFYWEAIRCYQRPGQVFRCAQKDFELPAGNGKHYSIKKGELLYVYIPMVHRDPNIFENPDEFNIYRFKKNPEHREHVYHLGFTSSQDVQTAPFGCAAEVSNNMASTMTKMMLASFIQKVEWTLDQVPAFGVEFQGAVGPEDLGFSKIWARQDDVSHGHHQHGEC